MPKLHTVFEKIRKNRNFLDLIFFNLQEFPLCQILIRPPCWYYNQYGVSISQPVIENKSRIVIMSEFTCMYLNKIYHLI